jgi:hypothetical protein
MVSKKVYVQGGIGAVGDGERFGADYELPNTTAYNETCASVGEVFWNQRMFLLHGDSKYIDLLEKVLYNGLISGVGLDGKSFFYTNAMQVVKDSNYADLEKTRSGWFECSCCPTNIARFLPSLPGYIYAEQGDHLYVNLFIAGTANVKIGGKAVRITQVNGYPWKGNLNFMVDPVSPVRMDLRLRLPGWVRSVAIPSNLYTFERSSASAVSPVIKVNGKEVEYKQEKGYAVIGRTWKKGDRVEMVLPMPVREVVANDSLKDDRGKVALQRGPIMYSAEWKDNGGTVSDFEIPRRAVFTPEYEGDLLRGVTVLKGEVMRQGQAGKVEMTAIPYCDWANRGEGEMRVWFPMEEAVHGE